jgi:hypothetical protein
MCETFQSELVAFHVLRAVRRHWSWLAMSALYSLLSGCGPLGSVEERSETINKLTATYSASAIFYNILRSRSAEPLNFISLTGVTGHDSQNLSIGLPTIIIGPGRTSADHLFRFGPNTIGASESDDFNVNRVDDPASYIALSRPVDPATIGFFINQFMVNRDLLFFLFVSRIQIIDHTGKIKREYYNEPLVFDPEKKQYVLYQVFVSEFFARMLDYVNNGLTVFVDHSFPSKYGIFCFEPNRPDNARTGTGVGNICPPPTDEGKPNMEATASKPSKPIPLGSGMNQKNIVAKGEIAISGQAQISTSGKPETTTVSWSFDDPAPDNKGGKIHVYTRSVFGMYRYLGEIINLRENDELERSPTLSYPGSIFAGSPRTEMLHVTHDIAGCWANVVYDNRQWCVPNEAFGTKRTFALLHQLFELNASPSNQPVTSTVRVTP